VRGFGIGIGAAPAAFQEDETAGTAPGPAMGPTAVLTAILVPLMLALATLAPPSPRGDVP
jgi:putative effector of murein hydrolase